MTRSREGRQRPVSFKSLVLLLLVTGLVPQWGQTLKCYSCDGGPLCDDPDASLAIKECGKGTKACFKSGSPSQMIRGCAPKSLIRFFNKHIRPLPPTGNTFNCLGTPFLETFTTVTICKHHAEPWIMEPLIFEAISADGGGTHLCSEDFCNGHEVYWRTLIGNWDQGRCQAKTIRDLLFLAKHAASIRDDPEYARKNEKIREFCSWGASAQARRVRESWSFRIRVQMWFRTSKETIYYVDHDAIVLVVIVVWLICLITRN